MGQARNGGYGGIPRWIYVIAAAGGLFVLLPLAAMVAKVNWAAVHPADHLGIVADRPRA